MSKELEMLGRLKDKADLHTERVNIGKMIDVEKDNNKLFYDTIKQTLTRPLDSELEAIVNKLDIIKTWLFQYDNQDRMVNLTAVCKEIDYVKLQIDQALRLTPQITSDDIATMITNAYGSDFLGKWHYNKELKQFECKSGNVHAISPRYEHIKNLWTLNLNERIKVLQFFIQESESE